MKRIIFSLFILTIIFYSSAFSKERISLPSWLTDPGEKNRKKNRDVYFGTF